MKNPTIWFAATVFVLLPLVTSNGQNLSPTCVSQRPYSSNGPPMGVHQSTIEFVNNCGRCVDIEIRQFDNGQNKFIFAAPWTNVGPGETRLGTMYVTQMGTTELRVTRVTPCASPPPPSAPSTGTSTPLPPQLPITSPPATIKKRDPTQAEWANSVEKKLCIGQYKQYCSNNAEWQGCPQDTGKGVNDLAKEVCQRAGYSRFVSPAPGVNHGGNKCGYSDFTTWCY